jgi:hypothetical protein
MAKQNESAFTEIKAFMNSTKILLESIKADIKQIREDSSSANAQVLELYSIMNSVGVKLDLLEQNKFNASIIAEKQPTKKRQTKSKIDTPTSEIFDPTDANYEVDEEVEMKSKPPIQDNEYKEEPSNDSSTEKPIKKTGKVAKKKETIEEPDESIGKLLDTQSKDPQSKDPQSKDTSSKDPTNVLEATKKSRSKKETDDDSKKKREPNRMEFFYKMYDKDNKYFSNFITEENEDQIEEDNKITWAKLPANEVSKLKREEMYKFMSKNHLAVLTEMKNKYNAEHK